MAKKLSEELKKYTKRFVKGSPEAKAYMAKIRGRKAKTVANIKHKVVGRKVVVKGFTRKGGVKVKGFTKALPKLSVEEKKRRAGQALKTLLPAAISWVGKVGFEEAASRLAGKAGIKNPKKLVGWLKGQAKAKGVLSAKHPYVGRKGFRKFPAQAKAKTPTKYTAYLRAHRRKETADEWLAKKLGK